ncbi:hypothetical protein Scep_005440 [Stephania cephalantha]|uniref:Uncharacterized protein n=1 Tax=Stephania cephalantha TaxID=152367 RepID=A0AAP0KUK3_9MAGN
MRLWRDFNEGEKKKGRRKVSFEERQRRNPGGAPRPPPRQRPDAPPDPPPTPSTPSTPPSSSASAAASSPTTPPGAPTSAEIQDPAPEPNPRSADLRRELLSAASIIEVVYTDDSEETFFDEETVGAS